MIRFSRRSVMLGLLASGFAPQAVLANPRPKARPETRAEMGASNGGGMDQAGQTSRGMVLTPDELIARANLGAVVAYAAIDPRTGAIIDERGGDLALAPASTLKAVTALYAQAKLGADHRFATRVIRAGDLLILAGGGDPELDTDGLAQLAKDTAAAEKAAGRGAPKRFAVWGGALPHVAEISPGQAVHLPYNPTISGIILNFNRVHLGWNRAESGYAFSLEARGRKHSPRAYSVTVGVADRGQPLFTYDDTGKVESWTMARQSMGKGGSRWLPVRRPELYAGDVFQTLCRAEGLSLPAAEVITSLPEGTEIARRLSPPLRDILKGMMEFSNNLTAEVVGLAASGKPTLTSSAADMAEWLRGQGISGAFDFRDHSGLSPANRVTAKMLAQMVAGTGRAQGLEGLMKHIPLRDLKGKPLENSKISVEAKTGTLNFVSNLTGYAQNGTGTQICFAILTGDEERRARNEGRELPDGVIGWTKRSKALQQGLIEHWLANAAPAMRIKAPSEGAMAGAG